MVKSSDRDNLTDILLSCYQNNGTEPRTLTKLNIKLFIISIYSVSLKLAT